MRGGRARAPKSVTGLNVSLWAYVTIYDQRALIGVIGNRTRVYEVMRGDRGLLLAMIRRLQALRDSRGGSHSADRSEEAARSVVRAIFGAWISDSRLESHSSSALSLNRGFFNGLQHLLDDLWVQNSANVEWQDHPNGLLYVDSMATLAPEKDESCF